MQEAEPHRAAGSLPPQQDGERIRRAEGREHVCQDKDSLIGEAKPACANRIEQRINSLLPKGKQIFSPFQESRASSQSGFSGDKCHNSKRSPLLPFPHESLLLGTTPCALEFAQLGSALLAVPPPSSLPTPAHSLPSQWKNPGRPCHLRHPVHWGVTKPVLDPNPVQSSRQAPRRKTNSVPAITGTIQQ